MFGLNRTRKLKELDEQIEIIAKDITKTDNPKTLSSARLKIKRGQRLPRNVDEKNKWVDLTGIDECALIDLPKYRRNLR